MTREEAEKGFEEFKAQGMSEEDILGALYVMFQDGDLTLDQLEALIDVLGYEFTDEFKNMSPEDQKTKGYKEVDEADVNKK